MLRLPEGNAKHGEVERRGVVMMAMAARVWHELECLNGRWK